MTDTCNRYIPHSKFLGVIDESSKLLKSSGRNVSRKRVERLKRGLAYVVGLFKLHVDSLA